MRTPGRRLQPRRKVAKKGKVPTTFTPNFGGVASVPKPQPPDHLPVNGTPAPAPRPGLKPDARPSGSPGPAVNLTPAEQAHQIAMSQIQPELDQYAGQQREEESAHAQRNKDLGGWSKWYQDQLNSAFTDTQNALNTLISSSATSGQGAQDTLAAALRGGIAGQDQLSKLIGGTGPEGGEAGLLQAAVDRRLSGEQSTRDLAASELGAQGSRRSLAGTQLLNLSDTERRRSAAALKEINAGEHDVLGRVPGLEQTALKDLRDYQLAKKQLGEQHASRLFQQWLSEKELNLKVKDQSFQQYLANQQLGLSKQQFGLEQSKFLHDSQIDWANVGIQRDQVDVQLKQLEKEAKTAKSEKKRKNAELRGKAIASGLEALSGYMAVQPGEAKPGVEGGTGLQDPTHMVDDPNNPGVKIPSNLQKYRRTYDGAMRVLVQSGVPRSDALRILMRSDFASWRNRAKAQFQYLKRRGKGGATDYNKGRRGRPD